MKKQITRLAAILSGVAILLIPAAANASLTPSFTQTINSGTLTSNIYQSDDTTAVSSPGVAFAAQNFSFQCKTSTATLGDSNDKINVTNLASGINTWNIALAATGGFGSTWSDGSGHTYKFNDATGSGCTNGQLSVDPSAGTITDDCNSACTANDSTVSKGTSSAFNHTGSVDSITLMNDSAGTAWEGYLTGINLSQKIPALQTSGSYTLNMTITLSST